jgi:hypothetical protein
MDSIVPAGSRRCKALSEVIKAATALEQKQGTPVYIVRVENEIAGKALQYCSLTLFVLV